MRQFELRRGNYDAFVSREPQVLTSGPAGTGKSLAWLAKIAYNADKYPKCRQLICRKSRSSLTETGLVSFERDILESNSPLLHPPNLRRVRQSYHHPNGSEIIVGGLDNAEKILSSEYDCLVGETIVESPSAIKRAYGRPYSGKLITIATAGGKNLTGTPNHPILTDKGWIALGRLCEGDNVVCRKVSQGEIVGRANPDVANQPTTFAELVRSLSLSDTCTTERVETVPMDFHGDGTGGYVDVVTPGGLLHDRIGSAIFEHLIERDCDGRDFQRGTLMRRGPSLATNFRGDRGSVEFPEYLSKCGHPLAVCIGIDPLLSIFRSGIRKPLPPRGVGIPDISHRLGLGDRARLEPAGNHFPLESFITDADHQSRFHQPYFPFAVELDCVKYVSISETTGCRHVYNLHTNSNWYIANGIISHNCIYVQEASELELEEWETLIGRLRSGVMPYQQLCADCNPTFPHHWLYKRYQSGLLKLIPTYHKDNPRYYQKIGGKWTWTDDGESYLAKLNLLTGFRRKRFLEGVWAAAEGMVYEGFGPHNLKDRGWEPPKEWVRYHSVDFGYVNPLVYQFWAEDGDGTLYLYREIYRTGMLVEDLAKQVADWIRTGAEPRPAAVLGDHDAEDRATFERHSGLRVYAADKTKKAGIQDVAKRLECQPNGKPRLYLVSGANAKSDNSLSAAGKPTCTEEEFAGYVWHPDGKDEPVKENDHGMDALRYLVRHRDGGRKLLWGAR